MCASGEVLRFCWRALSRSDLWRSTRQTPQNGGPFCPGSSLARVRDSPAGPAHGPSHAKWFDGDSHYCCEMRLDDPRPRCHWGRIVTLARSDMWNAEVVSTLSLNCLPSACIQQSTAKANNQFQWLLQATSHKKMPACKASREKTCPARRGSICDLQCCISANNGPAALRFARPCILQGRKKEG